MTNVTRPRTAPCRVKLVKLFPHHKQCTGAALTRLLDAFPATDTVRRKGMRALQGAAVV